MKVYVGIDKDKCIGCGACILMGKDIFKFDKNFKAELKRKILNENELELIEKIKKACPVDAIYYYKIE